jgi:hypothetical protein
MKEFDQVYPIQTQETAGQIVSSGATMVQTRSQFNTAISVQEPRQLPLIVRRLEDEAKLAGEEFYYGWGAGKDKIEGPSKELAFAAARCYGNCAIDALPIQETGESWIFTAAFIDLETGFTMTRQFRQSKKWTVYGKLDAERKDDIRFQIGQSKAARNAILNSLPSALIKKAMEAAKSGVREKLEMYIKKEGIQKAIGIVVSSLGKLGVKPSHVCDKFSIQDVKALTVENLVILKGDYLQIENGQERADALFPSMAPVPQEQSGSSTESNVERLRERIVGAAPLPEAPAPGPRGDAVKPPEQPAAKRQSRKAEAAETTPLGGEMATNQQLADIERVSQAAGLPKQGVGQLCQDMFRVSGPGMLRSAEAAELTQRLQAMADLDHKVE